jgi:hypothetical protein
MTNDIIAAGECPHRICRSNLISKSIPMLKIFSRSPLIFSFLIFSILSISGCQNSDPTAAKTPSTTQPDQASNPSKNSLETAKQTDRQPTENGNNIELLYGNWNPVTYIDANGQPTDLTILPDSEKETLSWEFTPDGTVKLGDIEGSFAVEGNQIIAKNESSGNEKRFEFSVSESELTIISNDRATLKLVREQ